MDTHPATLATNARVALTADLAAFVEPRAMALSDDGGRIVVAVNGSDSRFDPRTPVSSHLAVIDVAAAQLTKRIDLPDGHRPVSLALSPDGWTAYVAAIETNEDQTAVRARVVLVIDLGGDEVVDRIELLGAGSAMGEIVITPDGALLFLRGPAGVYVIDVATRTVSAVLTGLPGVFLLLASSGAIHLAMHPHGTKAYLADVLLMASEGDSSRTGIAVIDVATATFERVIRVPGAEGGSRQDLAISSDNRTLSHLDSLSGTFSLFDARTYEVLEQFPLGSPVFQGAIATGP